MGVKPKTILRNTGFLPKEYGIYLIYFLKICERI